MPSQTIPLARFLVLVRERAGQIDAATYRDPVGVAKSFISASPDSGEAGMLLRLMEAIQQREGEFKESEIYLLGPRAMVIASALANAAIEGQGPVISKARAVHGALMSGPHKQKPRRSGV